VVLAAERAPRRGCGPARSVTSWAACSTSRARSSATRSRAHDPPA